MAVQFTDQNFNEEVIESKIPVLVDIFATWCGPCKMVGPIVEKLAEEFEGKVKVGKLDVDESPETPENYNVMSVPTLLFFKDGELVDQIVGGVAEGTLRDKLNALL